MRERWAQVKSIVVWDKVRPPFKVSFLKCQLTQESIVAEFVEEVEDKKEEPQQEVKAEEVKTEPEKWKCGTHNRYKKSCFICREIAGVN